MAKKLTRLVVSNLNYALNTAGKQKNNMMYLIFKKDKIMNY